MRFSIVTTVLNGETYIERTIASVLEQSHADLDYRIIDAGSTDATLKRIERAISGDPRATVEIRPGKGMYAAVLDGLDAADGEWLAWINADDLYTPWAFARVRDFLIENAEAQWVTGLPALWDADGALRFLRPQGWHPRALIRAGWFHRDLLGFIQQESIFFSKRLYGLLTAQDRAAVTATRLAGDFVLWKRFARHAALQSIPSVLGGFRRHGANRSVTGIDAYMAEARADGAVDLPWPLTGLARRAYWIAAAESARRAAMRADS